MNVSLCRKITVQVAFESRFKPPVQVRTQRDRAGIRYYIQVVQTGPLRRLLLQAHGVLHQAHVAPDLNEAEGFQKEGLEAARLLHLQLSHGGEVHQLAGQQGVLGLQRAVLLQDQSEIAAETFRC